MGFFKSFFKNPVKALKKEVDRVVDRRLGIDDPSFQALFNPLGYLTEPKQHFQKLVGGEGEHTDDDFEITQPSFDPFAVDNSAVIGASEALRKRLANKRGLSSTNATGGLKSAAPGTKPTLFTFA